MTTLFFLLAVLGSTPASSLDFASLGDAETASAKVHSTNHVHSMKHAAAMDHGHSDGTKCPAHGCEPADPGGSCCLQSIGGCGNALGYIDDAGFAYPGASVLRQDINETFGLPGLSPALDTPPPRT